MRLTLVINLLMLVSKNIRDTCKFFPGSGASSIVLSTYILLTCPCHFIAFSLRFYLSLVLLLLILSHVDDT